MDLIRMFIVYPHLIACCVAIGLVFMSDLELIKQLFDRKILPHHDRKAMAQLQKSVTYALLILWVTGVALVAFDVSLQGMKVVTNPKLQAKIGVVILLTLNGYFLHTRVLPRLQKAGSLLNLSPKRRNLAVLAGVISGVSWFYAAMLGIGRPLNFKYSLFEILMTYPVLIIGGFVTMSAVVAWSIWWRNEARAIRREWREAHSSRKTFLDSQLTGTPDQAWPMTVQGR